MIDHEAGIRAPRYIPPIDWRGVDLQLRFAYEGKVSALCRSLEDCEDLVAWFGDPNFCPELPVLLVVPGIRPAAIQGVGYASAAELKDCAVYFWEHNAAKVAKGIPVLNFDELREREGLARREKADELTREALWERAKRHKQSPRTDPMRQPQYPNPTAKVQFPLHPGVPYEVNND